MISTNEDMWESNTMKEIIKKLLEFRDARDWKQFHNLKDLSMALSIETAELQEQFLWKNPKDANMDKVEEELADVFMYAFLLAHEAGLDPEQIINKKIALNEKKYPVEKSKGNAKKWNELK